MKTFLLIIALLVTQVSSAKDSSTRVVLNKIRQIYYETMNNGKIDLVENYYFVQFNLNREAHKTLKQSEICQNPEDYKVVKIDKVTTRMKTHLEHAVEIIHGQSEAYLNRMAEIQTTIELLNSSLQESHVMACLERTTPPYSDGHETTFVKVNGRLLFAFEMGRPD